MARRKSSRQPVSRRTYVDRDETCDEDAPSAFSKLNPWLKFALLLLTIAALIGGGIWQLNTTYASKESLKDEVSHAAEARQLLAEESVKTFKLFRDQMVKDQKSTALKIQLERYQELLNNSYNEAIAITNQLSKDPNNQYLKQRLENERNNQTMYRNKISDLLRQ